MIKSRIARFAGIAAGAAFALSFAPVAGAQTVAQLQAQLATLMAQIQALQGGSASASVSFTRDLTVGSTGADVTALQQVLVSKGFLTIPAGTAYGYFGGLTKAAVARWQASAGVTPAAGYFGPRSRAAWAATMGNPTSGNTTTGGTVSTGNTGGAITTPGVEGTLSVTSAPVSTGTLFEGNKNATILAFKAKAQTSDIAVQRVKLDLGTATTIYNKIYSKMSLVDEAGNTLASANLNSTSVVKDGSNYYLTLSGFSSVIPHDTTKTYSIKADVRDNIDSTDIDTETYTVRLAANGVRGVDGAGIDQFSPTLATDVTKTMSFSAALTESATLTLSTGADTPITQEVVASEGANNNELDKVTLLTFDVRATKDNVLLTDLVATVTRAAGAATASSTYLYVDGNQIGSASLTTSTATFSDIDYTIPKDTTKTFTLKADIRSANTTQTTIVASVANSGLTAENSVGDSVSKSGSATGNNILVRSDGPVFTLVSKSITYTAGGFSGATSTAKATFVLNIKAVGNDVYFGTQAASSTFGFGVYKAATLTTLNVSSSTSWSVPASGVVTSGLSTGQAFKISEGQTATVSVDFIFEGRQATGALVGTDAYAVGLESIKWSLTGNDTTSSTFMAGRSEWRTSTVTMP
ncbi:peptidoglycan-binding protein [Candidatus Parcubacteria bacterium]|nr:peptidoglycan-binding protein [Candidatus Parcubacteria bacterium]